MTGEVARLITGGLLLTPNTKGMFMGKFIQYTGPKEQKTITWLSSKPCWNKGNDYIVEVEENEAGRIIKQCSDIFKIVDPGKDGKVRQPVKIVRRKPPKGKVEEPPAPVPPSEPSKKLFGKNDGSPFANLSVANSFLNRIAKARKLNPDDLEAVEFADGSWITFKDKD